MDARLIFWPAVAMVVLTIIMTFRMFLERMRQIRTEKIRWREVSTSSKMNERLADDRARPTISAPTCSKCRRCSIRP